jgi:hypothetical protein
MGGMIVFAVGSLVALVMLAIWAVNRWHPPRGRRY